MDTERIKPKFSKSLRYILTGISIVILTVVLLSAAIGFFYEDEIKKIVVNEVNSHLTVSVSFTKIHFSILRSFPYCAVELNKVAAAYNTAGKPDTLFYFDKLRLKMHLLNVLKNDIAIRKAEMRNGFIRMRINKDGTDNFHFWKKSSDATGATA